MFEKLVIIDSRVIEPDRFLDDRFKLAVIVQTILSSKSFNQFNQLGDALHVYFNQKTRKIKQVFLISGVMLGTSREECQVTLNLLNDYLKNKHQLFSKKITAFIASKSVLEQYFVNSNE